MVSNKVVAAAAVGVVVAGAAAAVYLTRAKAAVASIAVSMVDPTSGPAPLHVELSGSALDVAGNGVPGATLKVVVDGQALPSPVTTDRLGNFDTALSFPVAGTYDVALRIGAVVSNKTTITVTSGPPPPPGGVGIASITLAADKTTAALNENVALTGRALDSSGSGVSGITLYLYVNGAIAQHTTPDSGGNYAFSVSFSQPGTYTVYVSDA